MTRLSVSVVVAVATLSPAVSDAGTVRGRITDLFGAPRHGISVQYEVNGRDPDTGEPYQIQGPQSLVTGAKKGDAGEFTLSFRDNRYRPNTKEVEIELTSPQLTPVVLRSFLGIATHNVQVVMPALTVFEQRSLELPLFALLGRRGSFYLMNGRATAFFRSPVSGKWHLADLALYDADPQFFYYRQADEPDQRWAFSRMRNTYCVGSGRRYRVVHGPTSVWLFANGRWTHFDGARKLIPENGYSEKLGTITVGKRADQASVPPGATTSGEHPTEPKSTLDLRVWVSRSGTSRASASLIEIDISSASVVLKKESASQPITVPIRSLSTSDQVYISQVLQHQVVR